MRDLDPAAAESLGIKLVEPTLEQAFDAAARKGPLSFQDRLCLIVAKANGWTCVSNDKKLREVCKTEKVPTLWGLELVALLVEEKAIPVAAAKEFAERVAAENRRLGTQVLARFLKRIRAK